MNFISCSVTCALAMVWWTPPAHADLASTIAQVKPAIAIVGTYKATNSPRFNLRGTGFPVGHQRPCAATTCRG